MKEEFENLQNAEVEPREKLKVTKADIVVALPLGEPYFNIHYREVGNDYDNIGFGSYDLINVIRWREEEMEIVSEVEAEYGNGWIDVKDRLPNKEEYNNCNGQFIVSDGNRTYATYFDIYDTFKFGEPTMNGFRVDRRVIAWMLLPSPFKPEKGE